MRKLIYSILILSSFACLYGENNYKERQMAEELIAILEPMGFLNLKKYIPSRQEEIPDQLAKIPDAKLTRMIAAYVFTSKTNFYGKEGQNPFSDPVIRRLLNTYRGLITDDREFRKMLANEQDARRFHLLKVNLRSRVSDDENAIHIKEMARMLMREDPVGHAIGDYNSPLWHDVSIGTYNSIIADLKIVGASFKEPDQFLSHEERKLILARWLKENWPGCEGLDISTQLKADKKASSQKVTSDAVTREFSIENISPKDNETRDPSILEKASNHLPWIIAGVLLLGILTLLFKFFKSKSTS